MTLIVADADRKRMEWRAGAKVFARAMHGALNRVPIGPGTTLLDAAEALVPTLPRDAQIAWNKVTQFERDNHDISKWAPALIVSLKPGASQAELGEIIDAIFILAIALETGLTEAAIEDAEIALLSLLA